MYARAGPKRGEPVGPGVAEATVPFQRPALPPVVSWRCATKLRARVHDENEASLRMFAANGFREVERPEGRIILECRLADVSGAVAVGAPGSK